MFVYVLQVSSHNLIFSFLMDNQILLGKEIILFLVILEIELMDGIEPLPEQTEVEVGNKDDFSDASPTRPRVSNYILFIHKTAITCSYKIKYKSLQTSI